MPEVWAKFGINLMIVNHDNNRVSFKDRKRKRDGVKCVNPPLMIRNNVERREILFKLFRKISHQILLHLKYLNVRALMLIMSTIVFSESVFSSRFVMVAWFYRLQCFYDKYIDYI